MTTPEEPLRHQPLGSAAAERLADWRLCRRGKFSVITSFAGMPCVRSRAAVSSRQSGLTVSGRVITVPPRAVELPRATRRLFSQHVQHLVAAGWLYLPREPHAFSRT